MKLSSKTFQFIVTVACCIAGNCAGQCEVELDGQSVLEYLKKAGSFPVIDESTGCSFDHSKFTFDAGPDSACLVHFSDSLLRDDWIFSKPTAKGVFDAQVQSNELQVTIHPNGGFKPEKFKFKYSNTASQVDCKKLDVSIGSVFK